MRTGHRNGRCEVASATAVRRSLKRLADRCSEAQRSASIKDADRTKIKAHRDQVHRDSRRPAPRRPRRRLQAATGDHGRNRRHQAEDVRPLPGLVHGQQRAAVDTFRLRRTELKFSGDMSPRASWTHDGRPRQGAVVVHDDRHRSAGSGPHRLEHRTERPRAAGRLRRRDLRPASSSTSASRRFRSAWGRAVVGPARHVERALFMSDKARGGGYGDVRDLGVMVRGKVAGGQVEYFGGVFNGLGESQNDLDKNDQKAVAARVDLRPRWSRACRSAARSRATGSARSRDAGASGTASSCSTRAAFSVKSELMAGATARDPSRRLRAGHARLHQDAAGASSVSTPGIRIRGPTRPPRRSPNATGWAGVTYTIANSGAWLQFNTSGRRSSTSCRPRHVFSRTFRSAW